MALISVAQSVRAAVLGRSRHAGRPEHFLHIPQSLRAGDPSVSAELAGGSIGLRSGLLRFSGRDMFTAALEDAARARDLFAFAWLGDLEAARTPQAEQQIRSALIAWTRHRARHSPIALEPAVAARRALALLTHADAGLAGATTADFDAIMTLIADEFATLALEVKRMPITEARLTAQIALAGYALAAARPDAEIAEAERRLAGELQRQIHGDGGHVSRNPAALLDAALDLVPLRRLYLVCERSAPEAVNAALARMGAMLQVLQMPDRALARFNGMGATPLGDLLSVLRILAPATAAKPSTDAVDTGYVRLAAKDAVVIADTGPGPESLPGEAAFAGALSFEFSAGAVALIVNCGAGHEAASKPSMRATTAHSTLVLAGASSAPLVGGRSGFARHAIDARDGEPQVLMAAFEGYKARHSEVHHRTLTLAADGASLEGHDRLEAMQPTASATPYAIHFHLHPSVFVEPDRDLKSVRLTAGDGSQWLFSADGLVPAIEASIHYASASGAKPSLQLVLRSTTDAMRSVHWRIVRKLPQSTAAPTTTRAS